MDTSHEYWSEHIGIAGRAVLTIRETAEVLRICERSVRDGIKAGSIPHVRLGRRVLVPVPGLIDMLASAEAAARPSTA